MGCPEDNGAAGRWAVVKPSKGGGVGVRGLGVEGRQFTKCGLCQRKEEGFEVVDTDSVGGQERLDVK